MATKPRQLPNGRWYAQFYVGKRCFSKTKNTLKELKAWLIEQEGQKNKGLLRETTVTKQTLASYITNTWLPTYRTQVRSTYNTEKALGRWVLNPRKDTPFLGGIAIAKLQVSDFNRLYIAMQKQGLGTRGISFIHGALVKAFNDGVKQELLMRNPAKNATLPKIETKKEIFDEHDEQKGPVEYLSREQATRFLEVAKSDRLSALWHLLLDGGLRPGEAFALKWRHLDWEKGLISVRGTLVRTGEAKPNKLVNGKWVLANPEAKGWKVRPPKTDSGNRDVPLSKTTLAELKRWRAKQAEARLQAGPEWKSDDFIFTTESGNPLGNNVHRTWTRLLAQADAGKGELGTLGPEPVKPRSGPTPTRKFKPRFPIYILRHTCATLSLLDGVDLLTVSRRLGHKNTGITSTFYGHVAAEHSGACAESFDRLAAAIGVL